MVCLGSRCDFSLLKTLLCLAYSCGIFVLSISWVVPMVALQSRICSVLLGRGLLIVLSMKRALAASGALSTIGSCIWSIHPLFQSILSCPALFSVPSMLNSFLGKGSLLIGSCSHFA